MEPKPYLDDVGLDRFKQNMLAEFRTALENKVDKIVGKVLSSNDYTDEEKSTVADLKTKMITLLSDAQTPGSVEYITLNAMLAIIDGAPEDFNTLKEMSDWISTHEDSAATMNSNIQDNARAITALQTGKVDKETGKVLSSNDFTDADKSNLDSLWIDSDKQGLPSGTDFNNITKTGFYKCAQLNACGNSPYGSQGGILLVLEHHSTTIEQLYFSLIDNAIYARQRLAGIWNDWVHYIRSDEISTSTNAGLMSAEDKSKLDSLEARIAALENRIVTQNESDP